jgi:hypothetical protein
MSTYRAVQAVSPGRLELTQKTLQAFRPRATGAHARARRLETVRDGAAAPRPSSSIARRRCALRHAYALTLSDCTAGVFANFCPSPTSCSFFSKTVSIIKYEKRHLQPSLRHEPPEVSAIDIAADRFDAEFFSNANASGAIAVGAGRHPFWIRRHGFDGQGLGRDKQRANDIDAQPSVLN